MTKIKNAGTLHDNPRSAREQRENPNKLIHPLFRVGGVYQIMFKEGMVPDAWSGLLPKVTFLNSTHTISEGEIRAMMEHFLKQRKKTIKFMRELLGDGTHNEDYAYEMVDEDCWDGPVRGLLCLCLQNPELHHLFEIYKTPEQLKNKES